MKKDSSCSRDRQSWNKHTFLYLWPKSSVKIFAYAGQGEGKQNNTKPEKYVKNPADFYFNSDQEFFFNLRKPVG